MDTLADMTVTGRKVDGPTAELIELQPDDGPLVTAIQLEPAYRKLDALRQSIALAESFMRFPMVTGLVEMKAWKPEEGLLLYPTGHSRSVAEILKTFRDAGKSVGPRAAIELCYLGGMILGEAAETGAGQGVFSHGDLNPWRVLVRPDGELQIIGYGLPSPEVLLFRAGKAKATLADTWRYAPPERVLGAPEDAQADLVSLALMAAELILGEPLLDGTPEAIRDALEKGELPTRIDKQSRKLGKKVAEVLAYAVNFDPRNRYDTAEDFVTACESLLEAGLDGDTLAEAGSKVHTAKRGKALKNVDDTAVLSTSGRAIRPRGQKAVQEAIERAAQSEGRWESRGGRSRTREEEEPEESSARPRRRASSEPEEEAPSRPRRRGSKKEAAAEEASARPRRRGSKKKDDAPAEDASARPRRRGSKKKDDAEEPAARPRRRAEADSSEGSSRPRRRTRNSDDD